MCANFFPLGFVVQIGDALCEKDSEALRPGQMIRHCTVALPLKHPNSKLAALGVRTAGSHQRTILAQYLPRNWCRVSLMARLLGLSAMLN